MKVKRYIFNCMTQDEADNAPAYVLATDYDALLELARRLRDAARNLWYNEDDTTFHTVMDDSAWLEE